MRAHTISRAFRPSVAVPGVDPVVTAPVNHALFAGVIDVMVDAYPELVSRQTVIEATLKKEEEQVAKTLEQGLRLLEAELAEMSGSVWKVLVSEGQRVAAGDVLLVVESMKMEFSVLAPQDATVHRLMCREGAPVAAGQDVLVLVTED